MALMLLCSLVLALLAWSRALEVWHLALASFISGLTWTTDNPVRRTMIGEVVGPERMSAAMSIDVGANNASRMLGPTIGGILLATLGIGGAFTVSVTGYLIAAIIALRVRHRNSATSSTAAGVLERMIEGLVLVRRDPRLSGTMIITVIYNTFGWPFTSMIPVIGQDNLGLGPAGIGLLASMDGIGAFCGAIAIALCAKPPHFRTDLYWWGGDISFDAAGFCAGARSRVRGRRVAIDGLGQFRLQHHAGNSRLSCCTARDARSRLWCALRLYRSGDDRFPPSWLARGCARHHLGDHDHRCGGSGGLAVDRALVARDRAVSAEIVAAPTALDVS
jgi:MFS family permease